MTKHVRIFVWGGVMATLLGTAQGEPLLSGVTPKVRTYVEAGEVAGVVTLVTDRDRVVHLDATGLADREKGTPLRPDSIFWIASMTKPITGTAVMMLQEEGKLSVDDPVGKYVPELAHLKTADGVEHPVTIRQMLTHTSGMSELSEEEARASHTLAQTIPHIAVKPLRFVPGSEWAYCQSGINTAGRIIEIVSGQSLPEFLERRLFGPLGMKDTTFYLSPAQNERLAKSYNRSPEGVLTEAANFILRGKQPTDRDRFPAANGGLFSTAPDYGRFARMILNRGSLDGKQYLKPESVAFMTSVLTGDLRTGFTPGNGWGLAWCVIRQPQGITAMLSPGTFGHGGAYGTQAWIDPVKGVAYILMTQRANFPNSDGSNLRRDFQQAAGDALTDRK